ncbi:tyrosine-type recombinase/integrase [Clostridium sp.]|uniref:tyrosine-type recombinase/integrase n=1 Tax=Clostridium sp. TaxID=1506 RepID=UPI0026343C67|nr:tyrosine-type recombinase/integrase [uncultured Clostridium sp.]
MKKLNDEGLFQLIHDFLKIYMPIQKHTSTNTIKSYKETLNLLLDYITKVKGIHMADISFSKINSQILFCFLDWIENERNCSVSTRNQRLACIRSFYKYASTMDFTLMAYRNEILKVPLKNDDHKNMVVKYMSEKAIKAILKQPDITTDKGIRDQFFMILMYDTGIRDREILDLHLRNFDVESKTPCVHVTGKSNKQRILPLMRRTIDHFNKYVKTYHQENNPDQYLFYTVRHGIIQQMSDDNVARFMDIYSHKAKLECNEVPYNVYPHMWRHSRAIHLYRAGMSLPLLAEWLGHAQLETTQIYAYADTEMKREAIKKATGKMNPLMDIEEKACWKNENSETLIRKLYGLR